jgi:hypothetical protein
MMVFEGRYGIIVVVFEKHFVTAALVRIRPKIRPKPRWISRSSQ